MSKIRHTAAGVIAVSLLAACASSAQATQHASTPKRGCTVTATAPDIVEHCGPCTVIDFKTVAERDRVIQAIGSATKDGAWFAVGSTWAASDDATSYPGAATCQARLGGFLARFTG